MTKTTTSREETATVKTALAQAGIPFVKVGHGRGTACGWLHITLDATWDRETNREKMDKATRVAQMATGRRGDYDGRINVFFNA